MIALEPCALDFLLTLEALFHSLVLVDTAVELFEHLLAPRQTELRLLTPLGTVFQITRAVSLNLSPAIT